MRNCKPESLAQGGAIFRNKKIMSTRLDIKQVAAMYHVQPEAIVSRVKRGTFPGPITAKGEKRIWLLEHIEEWERQRVANSITKRMDESLRCAAVREARMRASYHTLKALGIDWTTCHVKD